MPGQDFYNGLSLSERLKKFMDVHSEPRTRHISIYEKQMLSEAAARIDQTLAIATDAAVKEVRAVFEAMRQTYQTIVVSDSKIIAIHTFPAWNVQDPASELRASGLEEFGRNPTPAQVQASVAALMSSEASYESLASNYTTLASSPAVDRALDPDSVALLNRILYLPTVIAENSWADVAPLLEHLSKAKASGTVIVFGGVMAASGSLAVAFLAGGSVIVLQLLQSFADGLTPGLRDLGERLTRPKSEPEAASENYQ